LRITDAAWSNAAAASVRGPTHFPFGNDDPLLSASFFLPLSLRSCAEEDVIRAEITATARPESANASLKESRRRAKKLT